MDNQYVISEDAKSRVIETMKNELSGIADVAEYVFDMGIFSVEMKIKGSRACWAKIDPGPRGLVFSVGTGVNEVLARKQTSIQPKDKFWLLLNSDDSLLKDISKIIKELVGEAKQKALESGVEL